MTIRVSAVQRSVRFSEEIKACEPTIIAAAKEALKTLIANPAARSIRLHPLKGYKKPTIWKIDVTPNRAWQITFELRGEVAFLLRIATHKQIDGRPRWD